MTRYSRIAVCALSLLVATLAYQNCAPMKAYEFGSTEGSSLTTSTMVRDADISWSMRQSTAIFNRFDRATKWPSMQASGVHLFPPLLPNSTIANTESSGLKEISGGGVFLRINPDVHMSPLVSNNTEFTFDEFSIILLLKDVSPPKDVQEPVRIFDLIPADPLATGRLFLDVSQVNGSIDFSIYDWSSSTDYAVRTIKLTPEKARGVLAISIRFSRAANEMAFAINGEISEQDVVTRGTVAPLGYGARGFNLHTPPGQWGSRGSFLVGEIGIHKRALTDLDLIRSSAELAELYDGMVDIPIPTATPIVIGTPTPTPSPTPDGGVSGATLYLNKCSGCHGQLAVSEVRGKTVSDISKAIIERPEMAGFGNLTSVERQAIADALK